MSNTLTPTDVLRAHVELGLTNLRVEQFPLISLLSKRTAYQDSIKWQVNVSTDIAGGVSKVAAAPAATSDLVRGAALPIGDHAFSHVIALPINDIEQARRIGTAPLNDLIGSHVQSGLSRIMAAIETNLYVGTGNTASGNIVGLNTAIGNTTYAGINPATAGNAAWVSSVGGDLTVDDGVLTEEQLSAAKFEIMKRGQTANLIITDPEGVQEFEDAYLANGKELGALREDPNLARLGYNAYVYAGMPIIADTYCPRGLTYMVNRNDLELYTYGGEAYTSMNQLNVLIRELDAGTGRVRRWEIAVFPQLKLTNRQSAAKIDNREQ